MQQPAASGLGAGVVFSLLQECLDLRCSSLVLSALLQLTAAQQLTEEQVQVLFHRALQHQETACCKLLAKLPAAAAGNDAELQVLLDVLKPLAFAFECLGLEADGWCTCPRCVQLTG